MKRLKKTPESCRGVKHNPREVLRQATSAAGMASGHPPAWCRRSRCRLHSAPNLPTEQHSKQSLRLAQTFFGEHHRFRLAHRICDVSLLVQSPHDIPIEAFPGSVALVTPQIEQRQNRLIDLFGVDVHAYVLLVTGHR